MPNFNCCTLSLKYLSLSSLVPSRGRHHRPYAPHYGHYTDTVHTTLPHAWPWARLSTALRVPHPPRSTRLFRAPGYLQGTSARQETRRHTRPHARCTHRSPPRPRVRGSTTPYLERVHGHQHARASLQRLVKVEVGGRHCARGEGSASEGAHLGSGSGSS